MFLYWWFKNIFVFAQNLWTIKCIAPIVDGLSSQRWFPEMDSKMQLLKIENVFLGSKAKNTFLASFGIFSVKHQELPKH